MAPTARWYSSKSSGNGGRPIFVMRDRGTESFRFFTEERNRLFGLNSLVVTKVIAEFNEDVAQITGNVPKERQRPLPSFEELAEYRDKQMRYADYVQLALELTYCRVADSYNRYIAALLREILTLHPPLRRRSSPGESLPISYQVEKEVRSLGGGVQKFAEAVQKRYGIAVFQDQVEGHEIDQILETRHVFIHNHGLLDHRSLEKLGLPESQIGVRIPLTGRDVGRALDVVSRSAEALDERAAKRFKLPVNAVPPVRTKA